MTNNPLNGQPGAGSPIPSTTRWNKDLLTVSSIPSRQISRLLKTARELKTVQGRKKASRKLAGKTLGLLFEKPSTRTRVSFEAGMNQLGGQALFLSSEKIQLSRGESLEDTALVLSRYLDGLVVRTYEQATVEAWARYAMMPIINGLTDLCHPCQALADLFTISEKRGRLKGIKLAYIGDGNNIANSLIEASAKVGMHIAVGCPAEYEPDQRIVEWSRQEALKSGATIDLLHNPKIAAKDADVLYTDVWVSMGQEHAQTRKLKTLAPYQLNQQLLKVARPDAIVLHCLPAHRGEEITSDVLDGSHSAVLDQAENRLHMQKAILLQWLGSAQS